MGDHLKTVSMVSALFAITEGDKNPEGSIEYRAKFYKTIPGIIFPGDWDELSLEEKKKRLDKLDSLGLKGEHNEN